MQYLYTALISNNQHSLSKSKIVKLRHYEQLFLTFLSIALIFFLIFQNKQLNQKIVNSENMQALMEELIQQKIQIVLKEMQDLKKLILDESRKVLDSQHQNKNIILKMSKQLGLPFYEKLEQMQDLQVIQDKIQIVRDADKHIQIFENDSQISIQQRKHDQQQKSFEKAANQKDEQLSDQETQEINQYEIDDQICTYIDYLSFKEIQLESQDEEQEINKPITRLSYQKQKFNFSKYPKLNNSINYLQQNYEYEMHFLGNVILILGFIYGLFMFFSFVIKKTKLSLFDNFKGLRTRGFQTKKRNNK